MALTNRTLILFKYFWEATDEAHPVSLADISAHLKEHGITADPRTLRTDIEQLVEFGVDIVKERRVQNLYHVATRHFEAPEVKLLIDAVQSARFITPGKSKELVKRLTTFVAPGDAALLERHLYIDSRVKAVNESVYISVDRYCRAKENRLPLLRLLSRQGARASKRRESLFRLPICPALEQRQLLSCGLPRTQAADCEVPGRPH